MVPVIVDEMFSALHNKLLSSSIMFLLPSVGFLFSGTTRNAKMSSVMPERYKAAGKPSRSSSEHDSGSFILENPVSVEVVESVVHEGSVGSGLPSGPTLSVGEPVSGGCVHVQLPVDSLALVSWDASAEDVVRCLKESLCRQLEAIKEQIFWKVKFLCSYVNAKNTFNYCGTIIEFFIDI